MFLLAEWEILHLSQKFNLKEPIGSFFFAKHVKSDKIFSGVNYAKLIKSNFVIKQCC